ncbi:hypothetical protein ACQCT3_18120 [Sutcliffiella horikoshii]|uniref:hypothetical protein n=1 Tax=Sutcliffiella horikoshii TaxID=79883 RepID=UPI003CF8E1CF
MVNTKIKKQIKANLAESKIDKQGNCPKCGNKVTFNLDFKKDIATCKACKEVFPIQDDIYNDIYKEFKKIGVVFN